MPAISLSCMGWLGSIILGTRSPIRPLQIGASLAVVVLTSHAFVSAKASAASGNAIASLLTPNSTAACSWKGINDCELCAGAGNSAGQWCTTWRTRKRRLWPRWALLSFLGCGGIAGTMTERNAVMVALLETTGSAMCSVGEAHAPAACTACLTECSSNLGGYGGEGFLELICARDPQGQEEAAVGAGEGVSERADLPADIRAAVAVGAGGDAAPWAHLAAGTHPDSIRCCFGMPHCGFCIATMQLESCCPCSHPCSNVCTLLL